MRRRGSACVTLGDRISTQPASTAVVGGLAVAAIVFFGAVAWLVRRFGGLGGSTALG
jgi:flagellar biogenesis protein FliO